MSKNVSDDRPSWDLHETFLAVMDEGSLSGAARQLGVAQPTVRRRVEALEASVGERLFTRAPNGLVPTEAAESALAHARSIASRVYAFSRSASGSTQEVRGTVRLAASEVVGVHILPRAISELQQLHGKLQVELVVSNRNEDLLRRDADIAVRMVRPTQAALVAKKIGRVPIGFYASKEYRERTGVPKSKKDLANHSLVGPDRQRAPFEALRAMGLPHRRRDYAIRSDNDLVQLAAVRAGGGIGICQVRLARQWPDLERVLPRTTAYLEMWIVMHEDLRKEKRVRAAFDHLRTALASAVD